jgi:hypothetical protein
VSSIYFARSGAGTDVAVGNMGVAVKKGVAVAVGVVVAVGVAVGSGTKDEQDERINVKRKITRMDGVSLFGMGCILTKKSDLRVIANHPMGKGLAGLKNLHPFHSFPQERKQEKQSCR